MLLGVSFGKRPRSFWSDTGRTPSDLLRPGPPGPFSPVAPRASPWRIGAQSSAVVRHDWDEDTYHVKLARVGDLPASILWFVWRLAGCSSNPVLGRQRGNWQIRTVPHTSTWRRTASPPCHPCRKTLDPASSKNRSPQKDIVRRRLRREGGGEREPLLEATPSDEKEKAPTRKMAGGGFKASTSLHWCVFVNPLAWLLIVLDLVVFLIVGLCGCCSRLLNKTWRTVVVNGARRFWTSEDGLKTTPFPGLSTAYDLAARSFEQWAGRDALGTRTFVGWHKPDGAKFPLKMFAETTWQTYDAVGVRAHNFGKGLATLGMVPLPEDEGREGGTDFEQTSEPHTLLVYEETCADWMTGVIGAFSQSFCVATSYATLGISSVADAAQECNVKVILCNLKDVQKVANEAKNMPMLTHIVYTTNYCTEDDIAKLSAEAPSGKISVMSFDDVCAAGEQSGLPINKPTADNMAVVMYTSGSTGKPKGVMIRHKNMCASVAALYSYATGAGLVEGQETYLAYLPAAHILELCAEFAMFVFGAKIGYCDPKTISSKGAVRRKPDGSLSTVALSSYVEGEDNFAPGGIQEFRPTFMAAVPKIWDILKKGVEDGVGKKSATVQGLFNLAFAYKNFMVNLGADSYVLGALFKKKFKPILGGRQKLFVSGGGPIAAEVQTFIRLVFATPLVQGYALTETTCAGSVQFPTDPRNGVVGPPVSSIEIRLRDCVEEEMDVEGKSTGKTIPSVMDRDGRPYLTADRYHYGAPVAGRGEVLIRGPSVSSGYLKKPEKTAAEFDSDGWFHTGDIAVFTTDGCLRIVDRLKNLIKMKGGEYIAIESMEKEFGKSVYVDAVGGGIMCYGDGSMDRPVALVVANIPEIRKAMDLQMDDEALCKNPEVMKMVLDDLNREGNSGGLGRNELLAGIALISGAGSPDEVEINSPWTPENGMLTASNKLNRRPIMTAYESILEPLKAAGIR